MPGTEQREAIAVVMGELPELPFLPELPARGPGADMIGRTASLLIDMPVQTTARGWKLAAAASRDQRRAADLLSFDLDAMLDAAAGYSGTFKIQVCGPWTLAASVELDRSVEPALADAGAVADFAGSLAEGLAAHVSDVRARIPGATIVVQVDDPALPGVLAGSVPTASGLYRLPAVDESDAADALGAVLAAASAPSAVHCCGPEIPFSCITKAGATAVSFDLSVFRRAEEDAFGEAVEAGVGIFVGAIPAKAPPPGERPDEDGRVPATAVIDLWRRIGLPVGRITEQVVMTPACGLAGASVAYARAALARCQAAARLIPELIED